jgi:hypothetical protein
MSLRMMRMIDSDNHYYGCSLCFVMRMNHRLYVPAVDSLYSSVSMKMINAMDVLCFLATNQ